MTDALATSQDGQWAAVRLRREVVLLGGGVDRAVGAPLGELTLDADDVDLAFVGPPAVLVAVSRGEAPKVTLYQPPDLEPIARLELDRPMHLAGITGQRFALVSGDGKQVLLARSAGRALQSQPIDPAGIVEFVVGLERNQLLLGLPRKLEVWDGVSGRPMLKMQLQLPPPPRTVGTAAGHLWVTRPGSDEVFIYRLSDGRPFRHYAGSPIHRVICHPGSPVLVLVTARGLVRLQCFAHSLSYIEDSPWDGEPDLPLALLVVGDDIRLLGLPPGEREPWRVAVSGSGAPVMPISSDVAPAPEPIATVADKLRAMRAVQDASEPRAPVAAPRPAGRSTWREALVAFGTELARGVDTEVPAVALDTELGDLARRLALAVPVRRALTALYALHLIGEPALSIARLGRALGDWTEALGQGELAALAMLRRKHGTVALRTAVTDLLDGVAPRAIRLAGGGPTEPRPGAFRVSRDGRTDAEIEAALAAQLGRIGVVCGPLPKALLEARLHGATAVTMTVPGERPSPWPRDAGLVLVLYGTTSAWVADVPAL